MEVPKEENNNKQLLNNTKQTETSKGDKEGQKKEEDADKQKPEEESDGAYFNYFV